VELVNPGTLGADGGNVKVQSHRWEPASGWDAPLPVARPGPDDTLVLAFGSPKLDSRTACALHELHAAFPTAVITGCSTAGAIHDDEVCDGGLAVTVTTFDATKVACVAVPVHEASHSYETGTAIVTRLRDDLPGVSGILVLSEGIGVNGSRLVDGMTDAGGPGVAVSGGLAADDDRFEETWVLVDGQPQRTHVVAVGFAGSVAFGHGTGSGWDIFGHERRITRVEGNVLFELDGRPALDLYKEYLGERADGLPGAALRFPLAVRTGGGDQAVVRTILAVDEVERTLTFAGDLPAGGLAQLMRPNHERLVHGALEAATTALAGLGADITGDVLALAVSCVGRRLVMGVRTEEELEAVRTAMPAATVTGFYSYGEISPGTAGLARLHNQTMTVTAIAER
jgi:hypothetical protein